MMRIPEPFKSSMIAAKITSMTHATLAPLQTQIILVGDLRLLRMMSLEHSGMQCVNKKESYGNMALFSYALRGECV